MAEPILSKSLPKSNSPEYRSYQSAKNRCENPKLRCYKNYGGRGIEFHYPSFADFFSDLGVRPSLDHSLDRKDTNGHYERGNCRWATATEQQRNRRDNVRLTYEGIERCVAEWAELLNIPYRVIFHRLDANWCVDCTLRVPNGATKGYRNCIHKPSVWNQSRLRHSWPTVPKQREECHRCRLVKIRLSDGSLHFELDEKRPSRSYCPEKRRTVQKR